MIIVVLTLHDASLHLVGPFDRLSVAMKFAVAEVPTHATRAQVRITVPSDIWVRDRPKEDA